jgi:hypothetical protein
MEMERRGYVIMDYSGTSDHSEEETCDEDAE